MAWTKAEDCSYALSWDVTIPVLICYIKKWGKEKLYEAGCCSQGERDTACLFSLTLRSYGRPYNRSSCWWRDWVVQACEACSCVQCCQKLHNRYLWVRKWDCLTIPLAESCNILKIMGMPRIIRCCLYLTNYVTSLLLTICIDGSPK